MSNATSPPSGSASPGGTPVAAREPAEVEPLAGYFVNMLALRVAPSAGLGSDPSLALTPARHRAAPDPRPVPSHPGVARLTLPPAPSPSGPLRWR